MLLVPTEQVFILSFYTTQAMEEAAKRLMATRDMSTTKRSGWNPTLVVRYWGLTVNSAKNFRLLWGIWTIFLKTRNKFHSFILTCFQGKLEHIKNKLCGLDFCHCFSKGNNYMHNIIGDLPKCKANAKVAANA